MNLVYFNLFTNCQAKRLCGHVFYVYSAKENDKHCISFVRVRQFRMNSVNFIFRCLFILLLLCLLSCKSGKEKKKKSLADMTDAEIEAIYEQWEEGDEPLEEDELPAWKRKPSGSGIDLSKLDMGDPESLLSASKKGKSLMMFVAVSGDPNPRELEDLTGLWQQSLHNAQEEVTRYIIDKNRAIFMVQDGSRAWPVKDYLVQQDRCLSVTIEGRSYHGKASPDYGKEPSTAGTDAAGQSPKRKKDKSDL